MPESAIHMKGKTEINIDLGVERVRAAIAGMHPGIHDWERWAKNRAIEEIILDRRYMEPEGTESFLAAVILCRRMNNHKLIGRFSYTEALYSIHMMQERNVDITPICREVLGSEPGSDKGLYTLHVSQYLPLAVGLGNTWKLINQHVNKGFVHLEPDKFLRLMRDAITRYIRNRIEKMTRLPPIEVPPDITEWCEYNKVIKSGDTPPCITKCLDMISQGGNLSHSGRFLVAAYYLNTGIDIPDISDLFQGAPDYNKKITEYHINQIKRSGYKVPGCSWVRSNTLCPGCSATHPTKYTKN